MSVIGCHGFSTRMCTIGLALVAWFVLAGGVSAATIKQVRVTGEIIDSWCYLTEIMYPLGTAHHQCAVWCALGGIPVGILADDGQVYIVMKMKGDTGNVANQALLEIQSRKVTVVGDVVERDGNKYLLISQVLGDQGVVNNTHEEYGIQPFGE